MTTAALLEVDGYTLATDRYYDEATHLWVRRQAPGSAHCGFDPLGSETSGDIVAVSFEPPGTRVERGEAFGSLEAAKFVGPLTAPVSGTIRSHNAAVVANPALLNQDPLEHWLVEITLDEAENENQLASLLRDPEQLETWFRHEVARFRQKGMIAE